MTTGGHETVALVRRAPGPGQAVGSVAGAIEGQALEGADAVVAPGRRRDRRQAVDAGSQGRSSCSSRVDATTLLCGALAQLDSRRRSS